MELGAVEMSDDVTVPSSILAMQARSPSRNIGALVITNTILGLPYCNYYEYNGPQTLF